MKRNRRNLKVEITDPQMERPYGVCDNCLGEVYPEEPVYKPEEGVMI